MTVELIDALRHRILVGGGVGHLYEEELDQWARLRGLYDQLLEEWRWRPIAEAPIPGPSEAPDSFVFLCMLQTAGGVVGEGLARYVTDNRTKGRKHLRVLRWYTGFGAGERVCKDPRYFMPLPQPRKD